jgi:hypothetical protein
VYAWFVTYGTFTTWDKSTRYYAHLADAFNKGQLYVDIEPNADLVSAPDPYSSVSRPRFDDEIWDMSLYKGKLYIYWGPVPALLMTPFQARSEKLLLDLYPVYFFLSGLFIVNSLILWKLRRWFYRDVPLWNFLASLFLIGFILPILWSLNIPEVYEAAIGAGQFFLMGGILFSLLSIHGNREWYLFLAGLFWACSVGSRAINVFSVLYLFVVMVVWIFKKYSGSLPHWKKSIFPITLLTAPLVLGALLLGWYNWARFDSPFEFGLRYQITIYNLNRDLPLAFQPDYFPLNVRAYIWQPFETISRFPFLEPVNLSALLNDQNIAQPKLYAAGPVTGFLFHAPFLLLAFLPFLRSRHTPRDNSTETWHNKKYLLLLLSGSFLINFLTIFLYYYGQMRFLVDMISQITLLAIFGYWELMQVHRNSRTTQTRILISLANTLLVVTLLCSVLLSFSSETHRFEKFNPVLMEKLNSIFLIQPDP